MQNLLNDLEGVLAQDGRFMADGKILKNNVVEAALQPDADLLKLLLANNAIKEHFFTDIDGAFVFDKVKFHDFVSNKAFLPDSYTAFRNRLGLSDGKSFLKESKDVVLAWAYKDCVLEGGMNKEEQGRDEIFYNTTLAPDDITRLTDKKVFTNFEYWDAAAVKAKKSKPVKDITQSENLLIKGNNLLALHSLKHRYAGKVKLIYIDPPYNTENDSFRYNDSFNHSTWLTFMKNRLEVARELLSEDGVIFVQCDDNEQAYLKVLMDEIFGDCFLNTISVKAKVGAGASGGGEDKRMKKNIEYIHCYYKNSFTAFNDVSKRTEIEAYIESMKNEDKSFKYTQVLVSKGERKHLKTIKDGKEQDIKIYQHSEVLTKPISQIQKEENLTTREVYTKYFDKIYTTTNSQSSIRQRVWDAVGDANNFYSIDYVPQSGRNKGKLTTLCYTGNKKVLLIWFSDTASADDKGNVVKNEKYGTFWDGINYNNLNKEGEIIFSSGKKPEQLLQRVIATSTNESDLILDFFAGGGTTPAVAHKMGRRWIAVEQMDYIKSLSEARLKNVVGGDQSGISKAVDWKGGGDFIYCEIMEWNERYVQKIRNAKNTTSLLKIYKKLKNEPFIRYNVDMSAYEIDDFKNLEFPAQQAALLACIEMNHLYVNYSEMEDTRYKVPADEQKLNNQFYGKNGNPT